MGTADTITLTGATTTIMAVLTGEDMVPTGPLMLLRSIQPRSMDIPLLFLFMVDILIMEGIKEPASEFQHPDSACTSGSKSGERFLVNHAGKTSRNLIDRSRGTPLKPSAGCFGESKLLWPGPAQRAFRLMKRNSPRGGTRSMRGVLVRASSDHEPTSLPRESS